MAAVINLAEGAAPATPAAGTHNLYFDTSGLLHVLTDGGVNTTLADTAIQLVTANITDANIINSKLANMAEATVKGRAAAAGTGVPVDLTAAQLATILAAYLPGTTDAAWTALTLGANWDLTGTLYPSIAGTFTTPPGYRKVGGIVYLQGTVNAQVSFSTPMATLPVGYRPVVDMLFLQAIASSSTPSVGTFTILTTGAIMPLSTNSAYTYHFGGICFVPA